MLFSIRNTFKIQIFSQIEGESFTAKIDDLRNPTSKTEEAIQSFRGMIAEITKIDNISELKKIIRQFFPNNKEKVLRDFFGANPVSWFDLIRKLHKFKRYDNELNRWFIIDEGLEEIYSTFLIRGRQEGIGSDLRALLPDVISKNQELISYSSRQPSILDSGAYRFSLISPSQRKKTIKSLICFGLLKNIEGCTYSNIDKHFDRVFGKILHYLEEVFGITLHLRHCKNIDSLVKELEKLFLTGRGVDRENSFRMIQAFHAWGDVDHTEEVYEESVKALDEIPARLAKIGFPITNISEKTVEGVKIYEGTFMFKDYSLRISWRAKTPKSHLHKEWEDEEYVNSDVIRDSIGGTVIWPDKFPDEFKGFIIAKFGLMMPSYGYLLKNKGGVPKEILDSTRITLSLKGKHPLHLTEKRDIVTSDDFKNCSISGFMRYKGDINLGTEWQFLDEHSAIWKANDDKKYKPKSAIKAFMRGSKFGTPRQCYNLLSKRISTESLKQLGKKDINSVLFDLIKEGFILPYLSQDKKVLLLTYKGKKRQFEERFPDMNLEKEDGSHFSKIKEYIYSIDSETQDTF